MKARPNSRIQIVTPLADDLVALTNANKPEGATSRYMVAGTATGYVSPVVPISAPNQALSGTGELGVIFLDSALTTIDTTGAATALMYIGTVVGQLKTIRMIGDLGDMVISVAGTGVEFVTLNDVGDVCTLMWLGSGWSVNDNVGCVIA